ncbi:peptidase E [Leptolyngbya sp. FACHB-261]|uniref:Type 1 glutamine amidotransferase-like domain-containing protein n=1 Tax=Leptolyngbya sp. FACHB-261 TaxID=2692806 RepID=UPI0028C4B0AA|nr:peptidase E [Leptolyngbya sp. FACHB-261]
MSLEPSGLLETYLLAQTNKANPKVCFVPTASGESQEYIDRFYTSFSQLSCTASHLSLFKLPTADLRSFILEKDLIYVGGGNTKSLLALWREWHLDSILREAWEAGVVLAGWSAGSICWFEQGVTDSIPERLSVLRCLGFLKGSNCPHYDAEPERRPSYQKFLREDSISEGYAADNEAVLHFVGEKLVRVISSLPQAKAYRLEKMGETVQETQLESVYLGFLQKSS